MKLAIMQPYLFPYLGYFQLIAAVDKFVLYDDVAFIKQGWINRNQILLHGHPHLFTVPLQAASSNRQILETAVSRHDYPRWKDRFLKTIALAYSKAPYYEPIRAMLCQVLAFDPGTINELAGRSISAVCRFLRLPTNIEPSSTLYGNEHLRGQERVLDICAREGATLYINAFGGHELYSREAFASHGIALRFLRSRLPPYRQFNHHFVPGLSFLDILMFNPPEDIRLMLREFDLA